MSKLCPATVYVSYTRLFRVHPGPPNLEEAKILLEPLRDWVNEDPEDYMESIAGATGGNSVSRNFMGSAASTYCNQSRLELSLPTLLLTSRDRKIELRISLVLPTKGESPKVTAEAWLLKARVPAIEIPSLHDHLSLIVANLVEWGYAKLRGIQVHFLDEKRLSKKQLLRVKSLGIQDPSLERAFEHLYEGGLARDLLKDSNLDNKLTAYCRLLSPLIYNINKLSSYTEEPLSKKVVWFKMPICGILEGGEVVSRTVLYHMMEIVENTSSIGLAYDDSEDGKLVVRSGATLIDTIGPWI